MSKHLRTAYITDSAYAVLEELSRYRGLLLGQRNSRGQLIGATSLIDEAVVQYANEHMDELLKYRNMIQSLHDKKEFCDGKL